MRKLRFRKVKKHSQSHTAQAAAEIVAKSRILPGRPGFTLGVGILALLPGCCVTLGKLPSLSELHLLSQSRDNSQTYILALL